MNKLISIAIEVNDKSFTPEAYAYKKHLIENGYLNTFIVKRGKQSLSNYDVAILFHGFHPFWKRYPKYVIGEYHSLSTGRYRTLKNILKRLFNVRANAYVFLNSTVRKGFYYRSTVNHIYRPMGYEVFDDKARIKKTFDFVYVGSYRKGLKEKIELLLSLGFSFLLIGPDKDAVGLEHANLKYTGKIASNVIQQHLRSATYGLNFTPDIYPLNIQDSTKLIEYCAAGLKIVTNKYEWVNRFEKSRSANFLDLDQVYSYYDVVHYDYRTPNVDDLEWSNILNNSNFLGLLP